MKDSPAVMRIRITAEQIAAADGNETLAFIREWARLEHESLERLAEDMKFPRKGDPK